MKKITYALYLLYFGGYYFEGHKKEDELTVFDVLHSDEIPLHDKIQIALTEHFLEVEILHEFSCRCIERSFDFVTDPDARSVAAVKAKRAWLRGEITEDELKDVERAARDASDEADAAQNLPTYSSMYDLFMNCPLPTPEVAVTYGAWVLVRDETNPLEASDSVCRAALYSIDGLQFDDVEAIWEREWQWQIETIMKLCKEKENEKIFS